MVAWTSPPARWRTASAVPRSVEQVRQRPPIMGRACVSQATPQPDATHYSPVVPLGVQVSSSITFG
jgi:hypothetical protein